MRAAAAAVPVLAARPPSSGGPVPGFDRAEPRSPTQVTLIPLPKAFVEGETLFQLLSEV